MKNIFITGLPRGGTTLLSSIFSIPNVAHYMGETIYLPIAKNQLCSCGDIQCHYLQKYLNLVATSQEAKKLHYAYGVLDYLFEDNKQESPETVRLKPKNGETVNDLDYLAEIGKAGLDKMLQIFQGTFPQKSYFVESSKQIIFAEKMLKDSNWEIVLITRDIRGVANSVLKAAKRKFVERSISGKIDLWIDFANRANKLIQNGVFHINYEELCINPIKVINSINERFNLSLNPTKMHWNPSKHHYLIGNRSFFLEKLLQPKLDNDWIYELNNEDKLLLEKYFSNYDFLITKYYK